MIDLRTPREIERDNAHRKIVNEFLALCDQNPDASKSRIINKVASLNGMTSMGVRRVLERNHIIS